jgi:hypothetical protein
LYLLLAEEVESDDENKLKHTMIMMIKKRCSFKLAEDRRTVL